MSFAILDVDWAGVTIPVMLETVCRPQRLTTVPIHGACQTRIGFAQSCPYCRCKVFQPELIEVGSAAEPTAVANSSAPAAASAKAANATRCRPPSRGRSEIPVAGGLAQTPPKRLHCPNAKCGKEIAGQAKETPFCPKCQHGLDEADVLSAYQGGGDGLVALTDEERAKIEALRLKKGIYILRSLTNWTPSTAQLDGCYQVVPKKGSEQAFAAFLKSTQSGRLVYQAAMCMKEEQHEMTLCFERMVAIMLDKDGQTLLLHPLLADDELQRIGVPAVETPADLQAAADQHSTSVYCVRPQPMPSRTPADHALRSMLAAKRDGRTYIIEAPVQLSRQQQAAAAQLNERFKPAKAKSKQAGKKKAEAAS